ncbi:hypothetical protein [Paenibacillus sp. SN-8-1]|uniref:hypothetical protein n=1 Tax=Paenibacillus sp. SN-8-1 TaxID=3435409 RepID=UPI003D9A8B18
MEKVLKTPEPYLKWIKAVQDKITQDLKEIRIQFRKRGIKVYSVEKDHMGVEVKYLCRGYQNNFSMLWSRIGARCQVKMEAYLGLDTSKYIDPTYTELHQID